MERKLATIRKIAAIDPIPGADKIEVAIVDAWKVVVQKDSFQVGDLAIYLEIDSYLPIRPEFEFLRQSSYKKMGDQEGYRLRTVKMRGQISQGLLLPLEVLNTTPLALAYDEYKVGTSHQPYGPQLQFGPYDGDLHLEVGVDVTEILGITKFEEPIPAELEGKIRGYFDSTIPSTSQERIQNLKSKYEELKLHRYFVTEKLDGCSATYYFKDGVFGMGCRNLDFMHDAENSFTRFGKENNMEEKLRSLGMNIALQGELMGNGNQKTVFFFSAFDIDKYQYIPYKEFIRLLDKLNLLAVPIIDENYSLPETIDELLVYAQGKSILFPDRDREGLVLRSHDMSVSFKVISNKFLLSEK